MSARNTTNATSRPPGRPRGARQLADLAGRAIEPALLRRAGLTVKLLAHWVEIAGGDLAGRTRPIRVRWGRRPHIGEAPAPGTLVVACDGATALRLQHQADLVIERVNATFGWRAIGRIAIEQRPIAVAKARVRERELSRERAQAIERSVSPIEHERLRAALSGLGRAAAMREHH